MKQTNLQGLQQLQQLIRALVLFAMIPAVSPVGASTNFTLKADATTKLAYDSNVYLQDTSPNLVVVPRAVGPFQSSFVLSATPRLMLDYKSSPAFWASLNYAPEFAWYEAESSENYIANRGAINFGGCSGDVTWDCVNTFNFVIGSTEGVYFGGPPLAPTTITGGNAPAIGGIPIRDRREQFVYRGAIRATWKFTENLFLRPSFTAYTHNFLTVQKLNIVGSPDYGYENYVDRGEFTFGFDLGWAVTSEVRPYVGFRFGRETEGQMVGSSYHYDARVYRPQVGIEGQPAKWLKTTFTIGPDIHVTTSAYAPGFDPDYTTLWVDGAVTFLPTAQDSIALVWRQNTQPAFASPSVYDDVVYEIIARHCFVHSWSVSSGFRVHNGDWMPPVTRNDWIYTPGLNVTYSPGSQLILELGYAYDWTDSTVPNTAGREFTRHLVWLSAKYTF